MPFSIGRASQATCAFTALMILICSVNDVYADKAKTALKARYSSAFGACGLPSNALNTIAGNFTNDVRDDDVLTPLSVSSTQAFFRLYITEPKLITKPPRHIHTFRPKSENALFLWLPLPIDNPRRHVGVMNCHTVFEAALEANVSIAWTEIQTAAKLRKQTKGRSSGRAGRLESPIWRRLHSATVAQSNMRFLLWNSLAEKWSTTAPPKLWTLYQVDGYTFDKWEQVALGGTVAADLDQGVDLWFFEEDLDVSVRSEVGGASTNWTSDIAVDPSTAKWEPLPSVDDQKTALDNIIPDRDPEVHGDDTALQGQTFKNIRVIPGVPQFLCKTSEWQVNWQDDKIPEYIDGTVTWNQKKNYCSFQAATKIPSSAYPPGGGNSTYPFAIRWTLKKTVGGKHVSIAVQASVPLEGDLVILTEKNAYENAEASNGRVKVAVKLQISDPKQRLNLSQQPTLSWPSTACGWTLSGPKRAKFEGNTLTVELVFDQPVNTSIGVTTPRCSIEPSVILPAFDNQKTPTTIDRLFYILIDLPSIAPAGPAGAPVATSATSN